MRAVVTGATKGIGRAIAIKLAENGYAIATCARNEEELEMLKQELSRFNVEVLVYRADLGVKDQVTAFLTYVAAQWEDVAVLVNNAGIFCPGNLLDEDDAQFEHQLAINLSAAYYTAKFFGRMMRTARSGHIFNICSVASRTPPNNGGSYAVTKSAMLCLNNVLRLELAAHNVKVTAFLPGETRTDSWNGTLIPEEKFITPDDIAALLLTTLKLSEGTNVEEIILKPIFFET